jgi:hypothetical protein
MNRKGKHGLACVIGAGLSSPRLALGYVELGARLNGEIGRRGAAGVNHTSVIVVGACAEAIAAFRAEASAAGCAWAVNGAARRPLASVPRKARRVVTVRVEDWRGARVGPSPAPAASNGANGFPVRRSPVCFVSWVM